MTVFISILGAISWPVAFLVFGLAAAFGGLNRPLEAMSKAFGGIFKDLRGFKEELSAVEKGLKEVSSAMPTHIANLEAQVAKMGETMSMKLSGIESQIQAARERVSQEAQIALAEDTGIEPTQIEEVLLSTKDASSAIDEISQAWTNVRDKLGQVFPETQYFDKREYGQAIRSLANGAEENKPSIELAEKVASLHSRFKGLTRRRAFADEWMTSSIKDGYLQDSIATIDQIVAFSSE